MIEFISKPWAWYVSGPIIAFVMFLLLWLGGGFGVSSTLRTMCSMGGVGRKISFFDFDWKSQIWNIIFILGAVLGGFITSKFLTSNEPLNISAATIETLNGWNINFDGGLAPESIFSWQGLLSVKGIVMMIVGGFLVGFGARWAGGCTSGHAISGLANLQLPSLIAVIGFFIGGLLMNWLVMPWFLTTF